MPGQHPARDFELGLEPRLNWLGEWKALAAPEENDRNLQRTKYLGVRCIGNELCDLALEEVHGIAEHPLARRGLKPLPGRVARIDPDEGLERSARVGPGKLEDRLERIRPLRWWEQRDERWLVDDRPAHDPGVARQE